MLTANYLAQTKNASCTMKKNVNVGTLSRATPSVSPLIRAIVTPTPPPNVARNEKGALSYRTTESAVLDWFSSGGAMRNEDEAKIQGVFAKAFAEDRLLATKVAFYIRDVRGGQGQRKSFGAVLKWLAQHYPDVVTKNLTNIPAFGRWDDLWVLLGTKVEGAVITLVKEQLSQDILNLKAGKSISLLAKWIPSFNSSSAEGRRQARTIAKALGFVFTKVNGSLMPPKKWRKLLASLRAQLNVVERAMCAQDWSGIDYEQIPSRAAMIYRKAFPKHDPAGYAKWKGKAFEGKAKVHAATLYPYDIMTKVMNGGHDDTLELQWRNLPNYFGGEVHSGLVVCDTSGSMESWTGPAPKDSKVRPMDIALSLAMYMGERMNGPFKNHFITFSGTPELQAIRGNSLFEKAQNLSRAHWSMNTDIQAVFGLILRKAVDNRIAQADMPSAIYIVSDLQFDHCGYDQRNFDLIKAKFVSAGYKMPLLVFWQVRYNSDKVALKNEKGVAMVSGFSPAALKSILKLEQPTETTPYDLMLATVNSERYEPVVV